LRHLIVSLSLLMPGAAMAFSGTNPTGDTGYATTDPTSTTDTGTGSVATTPIDTGPPACVDCDGAADLAGEEGGSSCSTAPAAASGWLGLGLGLLLLRRR